MINCCDCRNAERTVHIFKQLELLLMVLILFSLMNYGVQDIIIGISRYRRQPVVTDVTDVNGVNPLVSGVH